MKTLNEIKEEVAKLYDYTSWSQFYHEIINHEVGAARIASMYERVSFEYAESALETAALNAKILISYSNGKDNVFNTVEEISEIKNGIFNTIKVDKGTILILKKQLK